jgi:glycosyltransferase involved in cell wall biosynthesis
MCEADETLEISLLTERRPKRALPTHDRISRQSVLPVWYVMRPRRFWGPLALQAHGLVCRLRTGDGKGRIWHSTYYTMPDRWDGLQVVTVADTVYERFPQLFRGARYGWFRDHKRKCIHAAHAVICISETTRQDALAEYGLSPSITSVVPLACSKVFRRLGPEEGHSEGIGGPFLLYVGGRGIHKNFGRLIEAYSTWDLRHEVALVVVGGAWSRTEARLLSELRVRDRVRLLTRIDDQRLCELYNQAVALVYPSLYEGFGIPLVEAMSSGCPIAASCIPSTREVAGELPIYFEPTDLDSIRGALDQVLREGEDSRRIEAGIARARVYSWDETAKGTLDVYRGL